jgi:hypothetical protein
LIACEGSNIQFFEGMQRESHKIIIHGKIKKKIIELIECSYKLEVISIHIAMYFFGKACPTCPVHSVLGICRQGV